MSKLLSLFGILAGASFAQSGNTRNQSRTLQAQKPELVVQTAHSEPVSSVVFSPDGKTLAGGHPYRIVRCAFVALLLLSFVLPVAAQEQVEQLVEANQLNQQVVQLYQAGRYAEAVPLAQKVLAIDEKVFGPEHPNVATALNNLALLYQSQGDYGRAAPLLQRSLAIREKVLGPDHPIVAQALNNLAVLYKAQGDYGRAAPLLQRALGIYEKALGPEHPDVAGSLNNLASLYQAQGDYGRAAPLLQRSLAIREKVLGPDHPDVATALDNLAVLHYVQGDYGRAGPLFQRSLSIREKALGPEHPTVAQALNNLALLYKAQGDYGRAAPLLQRALTIVEKALGPDHPNVATALNNLALLYQAQGDYGRTVPLLQRALAIYEKALGREHPDVATALNNLAFLYLAQGDYGRAAPLYQRSLAIREKALGPEHPNVAQSLNNLALLYQALGDFGSAAPLLQRSLAIWEKALGPEHPNVATALDNLAVLYYTQGDYGRAAPLFQRSLAIREKALAPDHPDVANSLNNLASLFQIQGDYGRAAPLFQRSLAIKEKVLGSEHSLLAATLANLATLYEHQGDYGRAAPLFQRALTIREKALGPEHPDVAAALNNLALLYEDQGDYGRAAPLLLRSLAIVEKALGREHPDVATALNNLAFLYKAQGDYGRAAPLYQRSLAIREKALGPEHPDVAGSLNNLALLYQAQGDYGRAATLLQRSLVIREKALGTDHPDVAQSLNNLASLYYAQGDYKQAVTFLQRARAVAEKNIAQILNTGSQQQKQLYLNTLSGQTAAAVSLHAREVPQNADAARLALTVILQRKGRALDATSDQIAALRRRAAPDDQKLLDQLTAVQSQLATLQLSNTSKLSPETRRAEITRLTAEQERLEDAISRRSAEFRAVAQPITLDAVRQAVPPDAALVELFVYYPFNAQAKTPAESWGVPHYVAYVLRRADDVPQFVDLGEAATIDSDASKFRAALQTAKTPEAQVKELARKLDERVTRPVRKLLGPAKRVFLAPDGALNLVPFDAFVDEDGHYLIENYSFNYLTSGRDLLRLQVAGQSQDAPAIVANPLFDMKSAAAAPANGRRAIGLLGAGETANAEARAIDFTALYYPPLTGTATEAKSIGALLPQARVWTQGDATEATLKTVNRPRILHIATHGFFLPDQPVTKPSEARGLGLNGEMPPRGPQQENPMLRSGLILAGVNQKQSGAGEDGVLTAQEAAGLNLFGTKLVVLSACETGLGDVLNGAGVYGLRRALVLAGSETQVMSLWQVSDTATRDLMIAYYTRLQAGAGRIAAMRQVQLAMLHGTSLATGGDAQRNLGLSPNAPQTPGRQLVPGPAADIVPKDNWRHPYYWAAFIPSGAWTTLDGKEPK